MGEKRKRSEKGKEKAEGTLDKDHSLDEEPLSKKVKVAEVVTEDMPPPVAESVEGEMQQLGEVEDRVEDEVEQPRVVEGLGQGAREARPDEAALVLALWELTEVCWRGSMTCERDWPSFARTFGSCGLWRWSIWEREEG